MADIEKLEAEHTELRKAHRKLMQEAQASGSASVPEAIKASARKITELEQRLQDELETLRSSAPHTGKGAMTDY